MGLDKEGATARLDYDPATNRVYIEKVTDIEALHAANKKVLQRQGQETGGYHSGDGFRAHVRKKYGA